MILAAEPDLRTFAQVNELVAKQRGFQLRYLVAGFVENRLRGAGPRLHGAQFVFDRHERAARLGKRQRRRLAVLNGDLDGAFGCFEQLPSLSYI